MPGCSLAISSWRPSNVTPAILRASGCIDCRSHSRPSSTVSGFSFDSWWFQLSLNAEVLAKETEGSMALEDRIGLSRESHPLVLGCRVRRCSMTLQTLIVTDLFCILLLRDNFALSEVLIG